MAVFENSRYLHTSMHKRLGFSVPTFDFRSRFVFNEKNSTTYQWIQGDTLDGVAYKKYGNCHLRWAIMDANPDYNTEFDIQNGDIITIPSFDEVVDIVNV